MDPFTITTSVLRITTTCIDAAKSLHDIRSAWERAPITVSSLCSQLKLTSASLSQIQVLILGENDILKDKPDLVDTFDTTLTSCLVLSTWLDSIMQKITKGVLDATKATWRTKFKTMWNEAEIKELAEQLHTQQGAISVLIGLLQMDSISEIKNLVRRHEALLQEIAHNTRRSRTRHSIEARSSILLTDEASSSLLSKLAEDPVSEKPKKEDSLKSLVSKKGPPSPQPAHLSDWIAKTSDLQDSLKATTQRKRIRSPQPPRIQLPPHSVEKPLTPINRTPSPNSALKSRSPSPTPPPFKFPPIPKEQFSNLKLKTNFSTHTRTPSRPYDESHSDALRPSLPILNFVTVAQSFLEAKERLQVSGVHASAWCNVAATRGGELHLTEDQELAKIRKANDYWYFCERVELHGADQAVEGLVERSNMVVGFMFKETLLVHAARTRLPEDGQKGSLMYGVGDALELNGIHHAVLWQARRHRTSRPTTLDPALNSFEHISVLDIELTSTARRHVDSLLDFVACPHPDLVDAGGRGLASRMRTLLESAGEKKTTKNTWARLFAHCRSFADLQTCARVLEVYTREMEGRERWVA